MNVMIKAFLECFLCPTMYVTGACSLYHAVRRTTASLLSSKVYTATAAGRQNPHPWNDVKEGTRKLALFRCSI
jgi:hypothetical protein